MGNIFCVHNSIIIMYFPGFFSVTNSFLQIVCQHFFIPTIFCDFFTSFYGKARLIEEVEFYATNAYERKCVTAQEMRFPTKIEFPQIDREKVKVVLSYALIDKHIFRAGL